MKPSEEMGCESILKVLHERMDTYWKHLKIEYKIKAIQYLEETE